MSLVKDTRQEVQSNSLASVFSWLLEEGADGSLVDVGAENSCSGVALLAFA